MFSDVHIGLHSQQNGLTPGTPDEAAELADAVFVVVVGAIHAGWQVARDHLNTS